ncbi:MAG: hypothetical protein ACXAEN_20270 [Candidatus Thorarchaeota archaeon]
MTKEIKESNLVKAPPLFGRPELIKVQTIRKKFLDQIRGFSGEEYKALLAEDLDRATNTRIADPWSTIRILGRDGYNVIFCYKRGADPTMLFGKIGGLNYTEILRKARYDAEGIEWPLDDESRAKVNQIDDDVWTNDLERLPQIFEA